MEENLPRLRTEQQRRVAAALPALDWASATTSDPPFRGLPLQLWRPQPRGRKKLETWDATELWKVQPLHAYTFSRNKRVKLLPNARRKDALPITVTAAGTIVQDAKLQKVLEQLATFEVGGQEWVRHFA